MVAGGVFEEVEDGWVLVQRISSERDRRRVRTTSLSGRHFGTIPRVIGKVIPSLPPLEPMPKSPEVYAMSPRAVAEVQTLDDWTLIGDTRERLQAKAPLAKDVPLGESDRLTIGPSKVDLDIPDYVMVEATPRASVRRFFRMRPLVNLLILCIVLTMMIAGELATAISSGLSPNAWRLFLLTASVGLVISSFWLQLNCAQCAIYH